MIKMQVTLFDKDNKYKPLSTLIEVESLDAFQKNKKEYLKKAIINISAKRYLTISELKKQGFTSLKVREYTPERIARDKKKNELKKLYQAFKRRQQE